MRTHSYSTISFHIQKIVRYVKFLSCPSCQSSIIFPLDPPASSTSTVWGRLSLGRSANASVDPKVQLPWKRQRRPRNGLGLVIFRRYLHIFAWCLGLGFLPLAPSQPDVFPLQHIWTWWHNDGILSWHPQELRQVVHWWAVWVPSHMLRSLLRCLTGPLGRKQLSSWLCRNSAEHRGNRATSQAKHGTNVLWSWS